MRTWFIEPADVLVFRGNRLFSGPSVHGEAMVPPWPSTLAGAARRALLEGHGVDPRRWKVAGDLPEELRPVLGSPARPGSFAVTAHGLAHRTEDGVGLLALPPADVVIRRERAQGLQVHRLSPRRGFRCLATSCELRSLPVLRAPAGKPSQDWLLGARALRSWQDAVPIQPSDLVRREDAWALDHRLGIALWRDRRAVREGMIYTLDAFAPRHAEDGSSVGLLLGVSGDAGLLPREMLLRLGGDGHHARARERELVQAPWDWNPPAGLRGFRVALATPLPGRWLPPGVDPHSMELRTSGMVARLVCAAVPRHRVLSGWDLAAGRPRGAERAAPAGSVYWFQVIDGDPARAIEQASAEGLGAWGQGLDPQRRAQGFGLAWLGAWTPSPAPASAGDP